MRDDDDFFTLGEEGKPSHISRLDEHGVPKKVWPDGPWQSEPDEVSWSFGDVPCRMTRNMVAGVWCGYVGVYNGHPWFGRELVSEEGAHIDVHGGVTWSGFFHDTEVSKTYATHTELERAIWWVGFDCHHAWDYAPGMDALLREIDRNKPDGLPSRGRLFAQDGFMERSMVYRDHDYVKAEVESLARQAIDAMKTVR